MSAVIEVKDLVQVVRKKVVLDKLSLTVKKGECFGLFGPRSAGKTTFLHILAGLDRFKSGSVKVLGYDIKKTEKFKKLLGLVTEERSLFPDLKAGENLDFIATLKSAPQQNIPPLVERLELQTYLNEPARTLKAGVYQRLSLACALLNNPALLIVDELIDDIDISSRHLILSELKNFLACCGTCLWSSRRVDFCTTVSSSGWLENGQITLYPPLELKNKWQALLQVSDYQSGENNV